MSKTWFRLPSESFNKTEPSEISVLLKAQKALSIKQVQGGFLRNAHKYPTRRRADSKPTENPNWSEIF